MSAFVTKPYTPPSTKINKHSHTVSNFHVAAQQHAEMIYCNNCGKPGHTFHQCKGPITSIGIIAFRIVDGEYQYLMIRRRDTLGYIDFMRGKYSVSNRPYILNMLKQMTRQEKSGCEPRVSKPYGAEFGETMHCRHNTGRKRFCLKRNICRCMQVYIAIHRNMRCVDQMMDVSSSHLQGSLRDCYIHFIRCWMKAIVKIHGKSLNGDFPKGGVIITKPISIVPGANFSKRRVFRWNICIISTTFCLSKRSLWGPIINRINTSII